MLKGLIDAITRLFVGNNTTDNLKDALKAHSKASGSREEVAQIIKDAELIEEAKKKG